MILNNLLGRKLLFHAQIKHQNLKHSRIKMIFRFSFFLSFSFMTCSYFPETFSFLLSSSWQNFVLHFFFFFFFISILLKGHSKKEKKTHLFILCYLSLQLTHITITFFWSSMFPAAVPMLIVKWCFPHYLSI